MLKVEHSANRLINLELTEKHNSAVWLHHNAAVGRLSENLAHSVSGIKRKIDDVNIYRRVAQEKEINKVAKLTRKKQVMHHYMGSMCKEL